MPATVAVTEAVPVVVPVRVAVATPPVVVVMLENVPSVDAKLTTVPSAITPPGPAGATVAVMTTDWLTNADVGLAVMVTEPGRLGSVM